jgi:hypothetical protein
MTKGQQIIDAAAAGYTPPVRQYYQSGGTLWAAYAGSAVGSDISLHHTERDALEAVVRALGMDFAPELDSDDDEPNENHERKALSEYDDEELREEIAAFTERGADDYEVQEVTLP